MRKKKKTDFEKRFETIPDEVKYNGILASFQWGYDRSRFEEYQKTGTEYREAILTDCLSIYANMKAYINQYNELMGDMTSQTETASKVACYICDMLINKKAVEDESASEK